MYSNNDYRYYLEHELMESDDFLAHYGVKGMKWKDHNYVIDPRLRERMAKGLGRLNRPRIGSNPMFKNRNGISSRLNGARRIAKRAGKQAVRLANRGKRALNNDTKFDRAKRDVKRGFNSAKKSLSKQLGANAGGIGSGGAKKMARKAQRKLLKTAIKSKTGRKLLKSAVKNEIKGRAKLKAVKGGFKIANSKAGRKALKKAGQFATSDRGKKLIKGAAKLKVKHDVNKLDRKLHRNVNKTVRKAKRSFNKSAIGKTYKGIQRDTRKMGRQIDRQIKINNAKKKARGAYDTARSEAGNIARKAKTQAKSTALKTRDRAVSAGKAAAHKAKTQARSTALKTRDRLEPVARKAKTQARSTALKTRDRLAPAANKARKYARGVKKEAGEAYRSTKSDIKRTASNAKNKVSSTAKKAYKYADAHVDRYSYNGSRNGNSYNSRGVRIKGKNSTTDVGVYTSSQSRKNKKGKTVRTGGDIGVEVARDNKKKRRVKYRAAGIGTRYGAPVYTYRSNTKKY